MEDTQVVMVRVVEGEGLWYDAINNTGGSGSNGIVILWFQTNEILINSVVNSQSI